MPQSDPPQHILGHDGMMDMKLEKASSAVDYRAAKPDDTVCGGCRFYDSICMACNVVEGSIDPTWTCNLWAAPLSGQNAAPDPDAATADPMSADWSELGGPFQIFVEAPDLKSKWIPYMPKPGKYQSPRYGEINVTPEMNQALIDSFNQEVYQKHIPLDAEHETKLSGAVAYIRGMRMNGDSSVDVSPEWTPRGKTLVGSGQFKYISPEFFPSWTDPATGTVHKNVVAGGAITTRPFFKEKSLRALVASERGGQITAPDEPYWFRDYSTDQRTAYAASGIALPNGSFPIPDKGALADAIHDYGRSGDQPAAKAHIQKRAAALGESAMLPKGWNEGDKKVAEKDPTPVTLTEAQVDEKIKQATEAATAAVTSQFTEKIGELEGKVTAAEATAAAEKTAREAATTQLATMEKSARELRFKDLIAGRGGENDGAAWSGNAEKNLTTLVAMAEALGEDSEAFKDHVENQKAIAAQAAESELYSARGSSASLPSASEPQGRLEALVDRAFAESKAKGESKDRSVVYTEVLESEEGKKLYAAADAAARR